jgi:hypothetical protein
MLPLDAFPRDRAQRGGLSYRCRGCDRAKVAAYAATPGALHVRERRQSARAAVIAACGVSCLCGADEDLSVYGPDGARLPVIELRAIAAELDEACDPEDVIAERHLTVSCYGCARSLRAASGWSVDLFRQRLTDRLLAHTTRAAGRQLLHEETPR